MLIRNILGNLVAEKEGLELYKFSKNQISYLYT